MRKCVIRNIIAISGTILLIYIAYNVGSIPQSTWQSSGIAGMVALLMSYIVSIFSHRLDLDNRFTYSELEDYEPNTWFIKTFGARLIKSKSNPYVVYNFFHVMFVPIIPIGCHGYTVGSETDDDGKPIVYWCGAKWSILDIAIIYWRWYGFAMIFGCLVKLFS